MVNKDYIRGFADADGCFSNHYISLVNTELPLLQRIQEKLGILGIHAHLGERKTYSPKHSAVFHLQITGYYNLRRWQEKIGFDHPKKRKRLAEYIAHLERPGALYNWAESERAVALRDLGCSWRGVGKKLSMGWITIYQRFRRGAWPLRRSPSNTNCSQEG